MTKVSREPEDVKKLEDKLKERHTVTRYKSSQEEDWFSEPEHFTSVALIHQKKHKTKKEIIKFANMHLKGDFTKSSEVTIDIADIFASVNLLSRPYTLLIEGAPGIGKTILAKEIVYQWANGRLLKLEKLVFLIYLRDPKAQDISTFESLIKYISYSQVSKSIEQYVSNTSGKGVTLVFDGYDEYSEELRNNSYLSNVIKREVFELQSCNIIVTSRPSASACLHNSIDLCVEILGFTKEHRKFYIVHALKDNPKAIQDLLQYLENNYSVDAYCHIPLSMAILVFLFKESDYDKKELPTTQTEVNYKFICITIRRFLKKSKQQVHTISKFSEVPKPHNQILLEISKLAFTSLKDDKIVFTATEIRRFCPSLLKDSKNWNGLDLLKAVQYFSLEENVDELSFNFLHFSVQELLAAYHISLMSENQQIKLLKETFWNSRYFNTWIMYVALTKDQPFAFKHFLSGNRLQIFTRFSIWRSGNTFAKVSKKMKENKIKSLHLFQCFTEAGNDDMCHYVGNLLQDGIIDLSGQVLSAVNLYTLSLFLARGVCRQWNLLDISNCSLDDENLEIFLKSFASLTKSTVYIHTINLSSNIITKVSASHIVNLIFSFNVKTVIFASNEIKNIGIDKAIFTALTDHSNLVQSIEIKNENQVILIFYKKGFTNPVASELFSMYYCTVENYRYVVLFIENNNSLFEMFLNTNSVSTFETTVHRLMDKMTFLSVNFKLYVKNMNFATHDINSVISNLTCNVPLTVCIGESYLPLHLYNISNDFDDENKVFNNSGTIFFCGELSMQVIRSLFCFLLAKNILHHIYLNEIFLSDLFINDISINCPALNCLQLVNCYANNTTVANTLSQVIEKAISLKQLHLSGCRLKIEHMKIISKALEQATCIKTITLNKNNLSNEICNTIALIITGNKALQNVELCNCYLQETGIISITKALESSKDLRLLDLSSNAITDEAAVQVATVLKCHSIKKLRLQNCRLQFFGFQNIIEAMVTKTCLQYIDISGNVLSDQNVVLIVKVIENNQNLKKLNFSNCTLQSTGCQQLFKAIAKITNLTHLDLSNNVFTDVAVDDFALMIHQNMSLEHLNISGCSSTVYDFEKITKSLVILKSLHHLDLSCNATNIVSAENVAAIITNNAYLEDLDVSHCEVHESVLLEIIIAMKNNHDLKNLYFNSNSVSCEEATKFALVVSNNQFLEKVDFSDCSFTEISVNSILSSLSNLTSLKHFGISSNTITNHVVHKMADVIDSNTQLTHLNISDSKITEYGILKIFNAAQRISTLKCIKMCNCTISDQAAQIIANAITVNCMIEDLVLTKNDFHETGMAMILDVLKEAHILKCISLACNDVISNVTTKVSEVVSNSCITHFTLSNCGLQKSSCSSILSALILQGPNLQHFDWSDNNLSGTAETIAQLISISYYLQYINLANTLMQDEEVMIIIKAMQNINSLRYIDLTSYGINDELALELQNTIGKNPEMYFFQVSKLCFKNELTIATFDENTFNVVINLQHLSICYNNCEVGVAVTLIYNSPDLQYLHLENCSMVEIDISNVIVALSRTTTLEYFCLINFVITDKVDDGIAAVIENNTKLKHFKLVACKVTEKGFTKCIQSFNLTQLSRLVLTKMDNVISHTTRQLKRPICDSLMHLNLSNMYLDINKLSFLSLSSLTKLQHLDLSHNPITDEGADVLSSVIFNNIGLKYLDLCDCKLQSEGIRVVADSLHAANITYLDISHNTIDIDIFNSNVIPALWSSLKVIEYWYLPYCELKQKEIDNIAAFISNAVHLKFIDFGTNEIPKKMVNDFKNITFVNKRNKQICFDMEGIKKVNFNCYESEMLYHSMHVEDVVNIRNAKMVSTENIVDLLSITISRNTGLSHFTLSKCDINENGLVKIIQSIAKSLIKLLHINFSHLKYSCEMVQHLVTIINCNVNLMHINLCNCQLSTVDVKCILQAAKNLTTLEYFDLSCNHVTGYLANDIITLIANNRNIKELILPNYALLIRNDYLSVVLPTVTDLLVNDIATLMATNKNISELRFNKCTLNNDQLKVVLNAVKGCLSLPDVEFTIINEKVFKLLIVQNMIMDHRRYDLLEFRRIDHLSIVGCTFDFKEWSINPTLHTLILFDCQLYGGISEIVNNCTHLKYLDLTNVNIVKSDDKWLSSFIHNTPIIFTFTYNLKTFSLNYMNFTEQITVEVLNIVYHSKSLNHFAMVNCSIDGCEDTSWWKAFLKYGNILRVDLSYSKINHEMAASILTRNENLTRIEMASCNIDIRGFSICNALRNHFHIEHLNLNNNKNIGYYAKDVASMIMNNKNLKHIEMVGCYLNKDEIVKICESAGLCFRLQHINLGHNEIAVDAMISMLSSTKHLEYVGLQKCGLKCTGSRDIIKALAKFSSLKFIDLSLNEMAGDSAKYVAEMITSNKNIEVLCLPDIRPTSHYLLVTEMMRHISNTLKRINSLKHVNFGSSQINNDLASEVGALTVSNRGIVQLTFSELVLTHNGLKQLGNSILIIKGLNNISITGIHFTDSDADSLATLINNNKSLNSFDISNCVISEKGKNIIFETMINLTSLRSLNLKNIVISDTIEDKVLDVIANNTNLEYIKLHGCEMNTAKLNEAINSFNNLKLCFK